MPKRGFLELLKRNGYQVETKKLGGGYVNDVKLVSARKGSDLIEYVLKKYASEDEMKSMMRGYEKISGVVKTPAIVYFNPEDHEVAYDLVRGKSVKDLIAKKDPIAKKAVAQLAEQLQTLHSTEEHTPAYKRDDSPDERKIRKNAIKVQRKGSITAENLQNIQGFLARYIPKNKRIIHGDAHLGNFLYTEHGELYMIDTDDVKLSDSHADLGKVVESIEGLESAGRISVEESVELRGLFLDAYKGEEENSVYLHQLRTPLIEAKTSGHPRGPFRIRRLLERLQNMRNLESKVAGVIIVGLSLGILLLFGLGTTGNSISQLNESSNLILKIFLLLLIIISIIYLIIKYKHSQGKEKLKWKK